jgi:microsomal dipeptidase-like Zn-dependent dipeptidase
MGAPVTRPRSLVLPGLVVALAMAMLAWGGLGGVSSASAQTELTRYSVANGCYALRSQSDGGWVIRDGAGYRSFADGLDGAEPFRMRATTLGRYLFYGPTRTFLAASGGTAITAAAQPSNAADWTLREANGAFEITNGFVGKQLSVAGNGTLIAVPAGSAGDAGRFAFDATGGCANYPEVQVNASGPLVTGSPRYGEVSGLLEGHMHGMAFEFLGGDAHCGEPWHRFGAPSALVDCPDHALTGGCGAILDNVLYGNPARCHDPGGWPTFTGWPDHKSLTHEQSYYKWLERAWRGGLRVYVNLMVENRVLCELYPLKHNSCNEMNSVLLQIQRIHEMEDYIDAQAGGPGKGFFRIVTDPFEAREVINDGKLAVVLGMEVSEPFGCRLQFNMPTCNAAQISDWIDRLYDLGLRQFEITNKFDNALTGVAGDSGTFGTVVNSGNFFSTGGFWDLEHCDDPENHDHSPTGVEVPHNDDLILVNGLKALVPLPALPIYPPPPHCNARGLSSLGEHAIRELMEKRLIFDPDHMSVRARNQALNLVESENYPGMFSSHSWSTPNAMPRIYKLGGVVTPSAGDSTDFVEKWRRLKQDFFNGDYLFGLGYGADQNGFASQGGPRLGAPNPVDYPFESFDGKVTLDHQRSGQRVYDINVDGVAHYGLYPDWIEDLRMLAGDEIVRDMGRGAEAYLQMWERTEGIPPVRCGGWRKGVLGKRGLGRRIRLGYGPRKLLERAGQPVKRKRAWRWCAGKRRGVTKRKVVAVFTKRARVGLVLSTLRAHRAGGIRKGAGLPTVRAHATQVSDKLWAQDAAKGRKYLYGMRGERVRFVALASRKLASKPGALRRHLKLARKG